MASTAHPYGTAPSVQPGAAGRLGKAGTTENEEPSPAGVALRYLGLLVLTLASAVAISGYAPADVVAAVGL